MTSLADYTPPTREELDLIYTDNFHFMKIYQLWKLSAFLQASFEKKGLSYKSLRHFDYYEFKDRYIFPYRDQSTKLGDLTLEKYDRFVHNYTRFSDEDIYGGWLTASPFCKNYLGLIRHYQKIADGKYTEGRDRVTAIANIDGLKEAKNEIVNHPQFHMLPQLYPQFADLLSRNDNPKRNRFTRRDF